MNYKYLLISVVAAIALLGAACDKKVANTNTSDDDYAPVIVDMNTNTSVSDDDTVDDDSNTNVSVNTNTSTNANTNSNTNTTTNAGDDHSVSGLLSVSKPEKSDDLESPFTVEGKSTAEKVYVSVKSSSGVTLFTVPVTVRSGAYKASITFDFTNTTNGSVVVFEQDAGGNMTNAVTIAVTFKVDSDSDMDTNTGDDTNDNDNENENSNENNNTNSLY